MSNVIAMNSWKKNYEEEFRLLHREEEKSELLPVKYMYGDSSEGLYGINSIVEYCEFASIEALREEIQEQREALESGFDEYGDEIEFDEIMPWDEDELLVCREGVFVWDWETEDYELIGKMRRTERRKIVTIMADVAVRLGKGAISLKQGESYQLDGEYVAYTDDLTPVLMLVITANDSVPIAVPYDPSVIDIELQDLALITEVE
ncbi:MULTISPECIES: hypothetical protein [Brevibacillus]|uniref:hypothetical protein n=1 Tax=Brevibacillus TaxID=55080 RepID=UPI0025B71BAC|nr:MULTISPECIES: hypothetical protein [Brevibacillus]MDN4095616.1 hypothetical protein [Brevibacillus agri]MDR9507016.1 hypothetical protein [Brevibacillus agri]WNF05549.1 hypothetical protein RFB14_25010 [Brevibacillus borstelensis]